MLQYQTVPKKTQKYSEIKTQNCFFDKLLMDINFGLHQGLIVVTARFHHQLNFHQQFHDFHESRDYDKWPIYVLFLSKLILTYMYKQQKPGYDRTILVSKHG